MAEVKSKEAQPKATGPIQNPYAGAAGPNPYNPYPNAEAKAPGVEAKGEAQAGDSNKPIGVRLIPADNADQPVFTNYASINVAPGVVFIDFGFFEPGLLAALPYLSRQGGKVPEELNGRLAVRVAMGYDALGALHQKLDQLIGALNAQAAGELKGKQ